MEDDAARTAESAGPDRPAPQRSVRPGGEEEYDVERLALETFRQLWGRGLLVLLGVCVLLMPLAGYHLQRMHGYQAQLASAERDIRELDVALRALPTGLPERLPMLREFHALRRQVATAQAERSTAARRFPLLLLAPFGLIQGILVVVLMWGGVRAVAAPLLTGLVISLASAVPFLLPLMIEHVAAENVAVLLGIALYSQLRHVLIAAPLARERALAGAEAFAASSHALRAHRGSVWVLIGLAGLLYYVGLTFTGMYANGYLLRGGLPGAIGDLILLSAPAALLMAVLIVASERAYHLVLSRDKRARAAEAGEIFA